MAACVLVAGACRHRQEVGMWKNESARGETDLAPSFKATYSIFVHVPQFLDWKPASVGSIVTIVGASVNSLAISPSMPPPNPDNRTW
jgi:hypothetical protein